MLVSIAFENFIRTRYLSGLSDKAIESYRLLTARFISYIGNDTCMEDITQENIEEFIDSLLGSALSRSSVASYLRNTRIFLKWYQEKNSVQYNAKEIKVPKTPKKIIHLYTPKEIKLIFDSIHTCEVWIDARNKAMIALMLDSGLRQGEICSLKLKNVYFTESCIKVCGKGNKERFVPLGKLTAKYLKDYLLLRPHESESVFTNIHGMDLTCNAVKSMTYDLQKILPFEFSSHKLRHNFATNYLINQYEQFGIMDIYKLMSVMGHEDVSTTRKYLHEANSILSARNCISHLDKCLLAIA